MIPRSRLAVAGLAAAMVLSVAACGGSSSTPTPTAPASSEAPASAAAPSAAASSEPSIAAPSAAATAPAPGASAPEASSLLSADMAASIVGGSPQPITLPIAIPNISVASYENADGDTVSLFIEVIPGGIANAQLQAVFAMAGAQGDLVPISGIGDAAGKVVDESEATVGFVKGSNLVVVNATSGSLAGSDLEPKVESLARQIASGL